MTKREGAILSAYTGILLTNSFSDMHKYVEELFGRPVFTHEFASEEFTKKLKKAAEKDFSEVISNQI